MISDDQTSATSQEAAHRLSQMRASDAPPTGPYILIIDDDAAVVDLLSDLLEDEGWSTIGMRNGMAGWNFLKNVRLIPSLILLDHMMPDMLGTEFIIYQNADDELDRIPVVLMSAGVNLQQLPPNLDVVGFLPKPFDLPYLFELCATYCRRTKPPGSGSPDVKSAA